MSKAPDVCLYCDGEGNGPGSPCGFCESGKPLDTQDDWDATWGKLLIAQNDDHGTPNSRVMQVIMNIINKRKLKEE